MDDQIKTFMDNLGAQVKNLDSLQADANTLLASNLISEAKHAELINILNDVAVGVDDLYGTFKSYVSKKVVKKTS